MRNSVFQSLILAFALGFMSVSHALAAGSELTEKLQWLKTTSGQSTDFEKQVYQALQEKTEKSEGRFMVRKGDLKIEVKPPNETLLVVNNEAVWLETPMGEDFPVSVQKLKRSQLKGKSAIWNVVTDPGKISSYFQVSKSKKGTSEEFELKPKGKASSDLVSAKFSFEGVQLKELSYTDELQNVVTYKFSKWKTESLQKKQFNYKPPKNAEVTEL